MPITTEDTLRWLQQLVHVLHENRDYLTQLDSAIGDADHGINMDRGFKAVSDKLPGVASMDIGSMLKTVGTTLVSTVGGASGPLYGTAFLRAGIATSGKLELRSRLCRYARSCIGGYQGPWQGPTGREDYGRCSHSCFSSRQSCRGSEPGPCTNAPSCQ